MIDVDDLARRAAVGDARPHGVEAVVLRDLIDHGRATARTVLADR